MNQSSRSKIDIVVPFYNEQLCVKPFFEELVRVLSQLSYEFLVIAVNDGSKDLTDREIQKAAQEIQEKSDNVRVKQIDFIRNYGHQAALIAGLLESDGDCVITMDGDLQHPPGLLPTLLKFWEDGNQVVQTVRISTDGIGFFKRLSSAFFYFLINFFTDVDIKKGGSDFRLLSKQANYYLVSLFKRWSSRDFLLRIIIPNFNLKTAYIEFRAPARISGVSHFSLMKMMRLFAAAMISYTRFPIYAVISSAFAYTAFTIVALIIYILNYSPTILAAAILLFVWLSSLMLYFTMIMAVIYSYKSYRELAYQPIFLNQETHDLD